MKRRWILIANIVIMLSILVFVALYSDHESKEVYNRQTGHFIDTTITMERITGNYLESEQQICNSWAKYINSRRFTMEEAAEFVGMSHVLPNTSAHLIYKDTLTGISTRANRNDKAVSYSRLDLFGDFSFISSSDNSVSMTRAYTNPVNGVQSMAFCNFITLYDDSGNPSEALLMRIVPLSVIENKWVFPQEEFEDAQLSMIDANGNYIIKGHSFKNADFFEFYRSYNTIDNASMQQLTEKITTSTGSVVMKDSRETECILAFTPISDVQGWTILSMMPVSGLTVNTHDWLLLGIVSAGLIILALFDINYMQSFNKKLRHMAYEAESASRAKTDFLSTMSHDIRTPMNAIIGLTTIAEKNIGDPELLSDQLHKIRLAGDHLLTLINDILDISKVESGKIFLNPVTFSLAETTENLVNISLPMVHDKHIDITFSIRGITKEYLYADRLRLNQIYINILSNAIKYTEEGSVSVTISEEVTGDTARLTYMVADTGIGMDEEFVTKMYQPFIRQTDSRVNSIQGTGLGLAITKQMVDLMGGSIRCDSTPGKGTCFTIVLDIPVADKADDPPPSPIEIALFGHDGDELDETARTLTDMGMTVKIADDIDGLCHNLKSGRHHPALILIDRDSDTDAANSIRRIRSVSDAKIILSTLDRTDTEDEAAAAGADGFINKPLFRSVLTAKINELFADNDASETADDNSDLQGLRILVAEDNDINWEIISKLLSMYGIATDRAVNGKVCTEMAAAGAEGYALIFMDVQMPVMNGLDATRTIRSMEPPVSEIPIIAMTADAFSENITECLEAGMNGHIAKPIDINIVLSEIRRVTERSSS
ncbi:MAG: response regulator [Oscillospiraceae bacterium]|nr:response regulator [Oscillospiraceae bacterium]